MRCLILLNRCIDMSILASKANILLNISTTIAAVLGKEWVDVNRIYRKKLKLNYESLPAVLISIEKELNSVDSKECNLMEVQLLYISLVI